MLPRLLNNAMVLAFSYVATLFHLTLFCGHVIATYIVATYIYVIGDI